MKKMSSGNGGQLQLNWEMLSYKSKLEQYSAARMLYSSTIDLSEADINETAEKLKDLSLFWIQ